MYAYLLCAGFGTRMRPLTADTPKSLLPVDGRPILDYLLDELTAWEALSDIHVAVNHRDAPAFHDWAADRRNTIDDIALHIHDDRVETPAEQLGSMGDLRFLLSEAGLPTDGALVSGGDSLYRFPLAPLLNQFDGDFNRALALYEPDPDRRAQSSVLGLDGSTITEVLDDPDDASSPWICPSWMLLRPDALEAVPTYLEGGGPADTLGAFVDYLAREHSMRAHRLLKTPHLRLHCNMPDDLERARHVFQNEARSRLDPDAVLRGWAGPES